jgi:hypothetical protein
MSPRKKTGVAYETIPNTGRDVERRVPVAAREQADRHSDHHRDEHGEEVQLDGRRAVLLDDLGQAGACR